MGVSDLEILVSIKLAVSYGEGDTLARITDSESSDYYSQIITLKDASLKGSRFADILAKEQ